jgi:hypothetical protein
MSVSPPAQAVSIQLAAGEKPETGRIPGLDDSNRIRSAGIRLGRAASALTTIVHHAILTPGRRQTRIDFPSAGKDDPGAAKI